MSESSRVARWRERLRQEGKKAVTVWLTAAEEMRLKDLALVWHCSPSEVMQQALAQFHPSHPHAPVTVTDAAQLRGLIRDELAAASLVPDTVTATVTARVTDTVTATITATLPALVREVVAAMAREHGSLSVFAPRKSDVTDTEAPRRAEAGHSTPEKAAVLARLRQMRSEGKSLEKMARELNAEGIPTLSGEGRWQKGTLQKLLKSSSSVPATDTAPDTSTDTAADACTRAPVSTAADAVTETRSSGATDILTSQEPALVSLPAQHTPV